MREMWKEFLQGRFTLWLRGVFRGKPAETTSESVLQVSALETIEQLLKRPDSLPENYGRFFLPAPLQDKDLFVGRDKELERLEEAFENWREGRPTSVAVVGPQGCGKTSLINIFQQDHLPDRQVLRCDVEKRLWSEQLVFDFFRRLFQMDSSVADAETLIARLLQMEPRLVLMEGAHNILLRVIGGRKAAETFLYIVLRTRRRHFWLLACRRLPWNNMDRHVGISRYFSHVLAVDLPPEDRLREALRLRLERCGLRVAFCRSREESERQPQADGQNGAEDAFYRAIFDSSKRNFYAALYFLLLCCRYESATQTLSLYPPDHLDMTFIREMDRLHLLTLAELSGHGVLSVREHEQIFRTVGIQSRIILEYLEQLNLVEEIVTAENGDEKLYHLSPVIHHAVTAALEQLNLLY